MNIEPNNNSKNFELSVKFYIFTVCCPVCDMKAGLLSHAEF